MKNQNYYKLIFSIAICLLAGFFGSIFTTPSIPAWYTSLKKPSFNPPNWLFGPVWTTLFILMGISLYLIWEKGLEKKAVKTAIFLFSFQLLLNILWSFLFFTFHSPFYAFLEILVLWLMILATLLQFRKISKPTSFLLFPYLLWVSFAAFLNFSIYQLNS